MAGKKLSAKDKAAKAKAEKRRRARKKAEKAAAKKGDAPAEVVADEPPGDAEPVSSKLKLLSEWNDKRLAHWRDPKSRGPKKNGVACPKCGEELVDRSPGMVVGSNPPRVEVLCPIPTCSWHGRRVA